MQNESILLDIIKAITDGAQAHLLLEDLTIKQLYVLGRVLALASGSTLPAFPSDKETIINWCIGEFDFIEAQQMTLRVPRGKDEFFGTMGDDGHSNLSSRQKVSSIQGGIRNGAKHKKRDAFLLPKDKQHFLSVWWLGEAMGLKHYENIHKEISAVLSELYNQSKLNPHFSILVGDTTYRVADIIFYGHRGNRYTYFTDPSIEPYIFDQLNIGPIGRHDPQMLFIYEACALLHTKCSDKINALIKDVLGNPSAYDDFPGDPAEKIKRMYPTESSVLGVAKDLCPWIERKLGLASVLPSKDFLIFEEKLRELHISRGAAAITDLRSFLSRELLRDKSQVVNPTTGRILKDAVMSFRNARHQALYLHRDIDDYLLYHWLAPKPKDEHGEWLTGRDLASKYGIGESVRGPQTYQAIQEILEETRQARVSESIALMGEERTIGDVIRRFTSHRGIGYFIHVDAVDAGLIDKNMILQREREIRNRPAKDHALV